MALKRRYRGHRLTPKFCNFSGRIQKDMALLKVVCINMLFKKVKLGGMTLAKHTVPFSFKKF